MAISGFDPAAAIWRNFDTLANVTARAIWGRLLPHSSGGAVLFYAVDAPSGTPNTYARFIKIDKKARDPNYGAPAMVLGAEVAIGMTGHTYGNGNVTNTDGDRWLFDAGRVAIDDGKDYYIFGVTTAREQPNPMNQVMAVTVGPSGSIMLGAITTFPGRHVVNRWARARIEIRGDGATGSLLLARSAQVDGGFVVQRVTLGAAGVQYGTPHPIQVEEVIPRVNATPVTAVREVVNIVVGDQYTLLVKAPGSAYFEGSDPYEVILFDVAGTTELEILDSATGASLGVASLSEGTPSQYAGGGRTSAQGTPRGSNHEQFGCRSITEGNVIYLSRLVDPDDINLSSTRELVALELSPASITVRPDRYILRLSGETGFRDDVPLDTRFGVLLWSTGNDNHTQLSTQRMVIDALEENGARRVLTGFYGFSFASSRVRIGIEDIVETHNSYLVMSNPGNGTMYVSQLASVRPVVPIAGDVKDTNRLFKTPMALGG